MSANNFMDYSNASRVLGGYADKINNLTPIEVQYSVWETMTDAQKAGKCWKILNAPDKDYDASQISFDPSNSSVPESCDDVEKAINAVSGVKVLGTAPYVTGETNAEALARLWPYVKDLSKVTSLQTFIYFAGTWYAATVTTPVYSCIRSTNTDIIIETITLAELAADIKDDRIKINKSTGAITYVNLGASSRSSSSGLTLYRKY